MAMDRKRFLERARGRGVNPLVYWISRAFVEPFCLVYFRMSRIGREHIPREGGVIIAANHRSFLDPFVIGTLVRRPIYFVAKKELFYRRFPAWFLSSLGAFPVDRGNNDRDAMETARKILERGDVVVIFPEGTRTRPGALGQPKRGVGRLALETGAPIVPVAVIGTEAIRKGWRIRPHKVHLRVGRPLRFPRVEEPSPQMARAVMERVWACVELQWEWLGGTAPLRRAAIVGAGAWGTGLAVALARAGTRGRARLPHRRAGLTPRENARQRPLPARRHAAQGRQRHDRRPPRAGPRRHRLLRRPRARAARRRRGARRPSIPERTGVLVMSKGLVAPLGTLPSAYVAERVQARAVACIGGPGHAADALDNGAALVVGSLDGIFATQLERVLRKAGFDTSSTTDVAGVELAGTAKNAAAFAAAVAGVSGPNAAGRGRGQGLRGDRRVRAHAGRRPGDVRRPRRRRRPRRDGRRRGQPQPPRRRAARAGHAGREHRRRARPVQRGARGRRAARADAATRGRARADARPARRARRRPHRSGGVHRPRDGARAAGAPRRAQAAAPTRANGTHRNGSDDVALAGVAGEPGEAGRRHVAGRLRCVDPQHKARLDADFSDLYRVHLRDVYSYAYYRVGNHHDAEDLTEQTFLQAYRHFERAQAESDGRPLRPWLIRIAHNLAANLYRDRSRRPQTPIDDTTVHQHDAHDRGPRRGTR